MAKKQKNDKSLLKIAFLLGLGAITYSLISIDTDNMIVGENEVHIINESEKSDLEIGVEAGIEIAEIVKEEIKLSVKKKREELESRTPIWVYKIGEAYLDKKSISKKIKSIQFVSELSIFQTSGNEYYMICKPNQTRELMDAALSGLREKYGLKVEIVDIQCREKIKKSFVEDRPIKGFTCYTCG